MNTKFIEVRDEGTHIDVLALKMTPATAAEERFFGRCGYPANAVIVMKLHDQLATVDPFGWVGGGRTMRIAHDYIYTHFDELQDEEVVDVQFILGETSEPKQPEADEILTLEQMRDLLKGLPTVAYDSRPE